MLVHGSSDKDFIARAEGHFAGLSSVTSSAAVVPGASVGRQSRQHPSTDSETSIAGNLIPRKRGINKSCTICMGLRLLNKISEHGRDGIAQRKRCWVVLRYLSCVGGPLLTIFAYIQTRYFGKALLRCRVVGQGTAVGTFLESFPFDKI